MLPKVTVPTIQARKAKNKKITALTAYDYTMARILDAAGIDIVLVGDSLGSVIQGHQNTLPVTLDQMIYHCQCVARGVKRALVVGDMPFLSYQTSVSTAIESAGRLLKEGGVAVVKLEGGVRVAKHIAEISSFDIPVMGHVGLTPQSFHRMGGHKVQGRRSGEHQESRAQIIEDARAVEAAGAFSIVLEGIPRDLAKEITEQLHIPTIGIGAGPDCDGQVLVVNDMLGMGDDIGPRFVKKYAELRQTIERAAESYILEVSESKFPADEHCFYDRAEGSKLEDQVEIPKRRQLTT